MFPIRTLLLVMLVASVCTLHMQDSAQAQIDALKAQQLNFEKTVNKLITNISEIEKSVNASNTTEGKIVILESAILSERETVFQLSKVIIPPFNISKDGCEKMTDQQKVELLEQLTKARKEVNELKTISATIPKCDDIEQINRDIEKQIFFLNSIESIIYTNCSMNVILSPTIWQTNIYASNWILGNMTIDDLIEQYYQRSIRYDNITNCPIETPFFDGKQCILCPAATPAFDISLKKCVTCPADTMIDNSQKKCAAKRHYSEWDKLSNYAPEVTNFVKPQDATPCKAPTSYYNGTQCIACELPKYFNSSTNSCLACPVKTIFDSNTRTCVEGQQNMLTRLSGTRWVTPTPNLTEVLKERQKLLAQKDKKYTECPTDTPYFDGKACISCPNEFSLVTLLCTEPVGNQKFSPNLHTYVTPEKAETAKTAKDTLGKPTDDPNVADCNQTHPYYDGVSCVYCQAPFTIFDLATKLCVACNPEEVYNQATTSCEPRPKVYISTKKDGRLATPARSLADYDKLANETAQKDPNSIVINCKPEEYSNFKECLTCAKNEYFNVETLKCQTCPDVYDPETGLCKKASLTFSNLNSPTLNVVNLADVAKEKQNIDTQLKQNPQNKLCDLKTPYWNGATCVQCKAPTIVFDYQAKKCVECTSDSYPLDGKCIKKPIVSNVPAIEKNGKYIETEPSDTLAAIKAGITDLNNKKTPFTECPATKPLYDQSLQTAEKCVDISCPAESYFDLKTRKCASCTNFDAQKKVCLPPVPRYSKLDQNDKWIAKSISDVIKTRDEDKAKEGSLECPQTEPYYNRVKCISCPEGQFFNFDTNKCETCAPLTFDINQHRCLEQIPAGKYQTNYNTSNLIYAGKSYSQWKLQYQANQANYPGIQDCPAANPYYDDINCIQCSSYAPYFNLQHKLCMRCPNDSSYQFSKINQDCISKTNQQVQKITPDIAKMLANIF